MTPPTKKLSKADIGAMRKLLQDVIRNPDEFPESFVVMPFEPRTLSSVFTDERLRLWSSLRREPPQSITSVAKRLHRNVSRVRQDLLLLERSGLVKLEKEGREVRATSKALHILIPAPA